MACVTWFVFIYMFLKLLSCLLDVGIIIYFEFYMAQRITKMLHLNRMHVSHIC